MSARTMGQVLSVLASGKPRKEREQNVLANFILNVHTTMSAR